MEKLLITPIAVTVTTYFYIWLVRSIDRFEKKPISHPLSVFAWGSIAAVIFTLTWEAIFSIPINFLLGKQQLGEEVMTASISVAVIEEIIKGIALAVIYLRYRREFNGWVDGILYGAIAGLGFAHVENIIYLNDLTDNWEEWRQLFFSYTIVFGGIHGFWSALAGIGFGLSRYSSNLFSKVTIVFAGLIAAMLSHVIHNWALVQVMSKSILLGALFNYTTLILVIFVLWWLRGYVQRQRFQTYLREEVPDFLSLECYEVLCRSEINDLALLGMSRQDRQSLFQVAVALIQKKMQLIKTGEAGSNSPEIADLRQELRRLGSREDSFEF